MTKQDLIVVVTIDCLFSLIFMCEAGLIGLAINNRNDFLMQGRPTSAKTNKWSAWVNEYGYDNKPNGYEYDNIPNEYGYGYDTQHDLDLSTLANQYGQLNWGGIEIPDEGKFNLLNNDDDEVLSGVARRQASGETRALASITSKIHKLGSFVGWAISGVTGLTKSIANTVKSSLKSAESQSRFLVCIENTQQVLINHSNEMLETMGCHEQLLKNNLRNGALDYDIEILSASLQMLMCSKKHYLNAESSQYLSANVGSAESVDQVAELENLIKTLLVKLDQVKRVSTEELANNDDILNSLEKTNEKLSYIRITIYEVLLHNNKYLSATITNIQDLLVELIEGIRMIKSNRDGQAKFMCDKTVLYAIKVTELASEMKNISKFEFLGRAGALKTLADLVMSTPIDSIASVLNSNNQAFMQIVNLLMANSKQ